MRTNLLSRFAFTLISQAPSQAPFFTVRFSGHIVRYTVYVKTHLSPQKERMQYRMEVHEMKTYNITRHLTTILTVFAAIFLLASCSI